MSEWGNAEHLRVRQSFEDRWHARYARNAWVSGTGAAFFVVALGVEVGTGGAGIAGLAYSYGTLATLFLCDLAYDLRKLGVPW